jgi:hypothetical protein
VKTPKLLLVIIVIILLIPLAGCNLIGQNPLSAVGSLVPKVTVEDTVEATINAKEATVTNTPLIRPKTVAATAKPKATVAKTTAATVKPKSTVKATVTKKATVAPTKAATVSGSSSLPTGAVISSDNFSDPTSGWAEFSGSQSEQTYQNGKFVITVHDVDYIAWSFASQNYADFVVEATAAKTSGPNDGVYGLLFRFVDNQNYYAFVVNATGSYLVAVRINNAWTNLIPLTKNSAIKTGSAVNKLAVVAQGDSFSFYANGVLLNQVTDTTFTNGDIAIMAGTNATGELVVSFSGVNVWEVSGGASPTIEASGNILKGAKLYSETFADPSTGWDTWSTSNSVIGYENGKYAIEVLNTDQLSWGNAFQSFDDFVIEVDTSKVAGPDDGGFGIVLRYVDMDNFYYFVVTADGQYRFSYYLNNSRTDIIDWTASDAINKGNALNKLGVACKGNHFILSINGTVVEDFTDDTFTSGDIGLLATSNTAAGVKVTFDNLNVWAVK